MSSHNSFGFMCHKNELIYHQAPYTIEAFNNISPIYYDLFLSYNYKQPVTVDDVSNNLNMEIMNLDKFFFLGILFSFFLLAISLLILYEIPFHKLYNVVVIGF